METRTFIDRLNHAFEELQANQQHFSETSYALLMRLLLDARRADNTVIVEEQQERRTDEIRLVTVMFVDVHESTRLAHHLDAGDWKTTIEGAHARISTVVQQWDGQVGQYLGDGVLCFFGAQRSQGDDALRCVSCALAIQEAINVYANEVFLLHGIEFAVRVGISTGRVVVGMIGNDVRRELLAMGLTTNLAARLQSLAAPGEILVDATTYSRVRNHFVVTPRPAAQLRGFEDPVPHYAILARDAQTATHFTESNLRGIRLPFVGRDANMQTLLAQVEQLKSGQKTGTVFITGEVGMGKSRLLQETLYQSNDEALYCFVMVSHYETRNTPWNLLYSLLMNTCHVTEGSSPDVALRMIQNTLKRLWDDPDAERLAGRLAEMTGILPDTGSETDRQAENIALLIRWFKAMHETQPVLLVVDNLQWADALSLHFLIELAQALDDRAFLMLCGVRLAYMQANPAYFRNFPQAETMILERLPSSATQQMVDIVLAEVERVPPTLAPIINQRASGNPFFVQELLGMLFENGVFELHEDGRWRFNLLEYNNISSLPDSLMGVFQARLDALPLEAREVLQVAAIIGQTFWESSLATILPWNLPPLLEQLRSRGIVTRQLESDFEGEIQYVFQHTLYRDVAYEMLPRTRRHPYHQRIAEWLMARVQKKPDYFPLLIQQLIAAEQYIQALRISLDAAHIQLQNNDPDAALILLDRGLALARNVPREIALPVTCQLWALRCEAFMTLKRYHEAIAVGKSALRLLEELPDTQLLTTRFQVMQQLAQVYQLIGLHDEATAIQTQEAALRTGSDQPIE